MKRRTSRVITEGKPNCPDINQVGINHAAVFLSPAIQTALIEWSQGKTPAALPVASAGP